MVTGPALGGVLAAAWGWRSLFWVNILPGLIGIVLAGLFIPDSRAARPRRVDPPGQILVIVFLTCLTCGIIEGATLGWRSPAIVAALVGSAAALALLIGWERRRADPLIDLRVFRGLPFSGALVITVCSFACLGGFLFLTTIYLQDVRGLTAFRAGIALIPLPAATAVAGPLAGRVMARRGARGPVTVGGAALGASCLALAQAPPAASWALLAAAYAVFGVGYGAVNTVIAAVAVAGMPRAQAGVAGGITSAGRQAGQSLGVSVVGAVFAAGLHGLLRDGFAAASHPAWLVIASCGFIVLPLGLVSTARRAVRAAALAVGTVPDHSGLPQVVFAIAGVDDLPGPVVLGSPYLSPFADAHAGAAPAGRQPGSRPASRGSGCLLSPGLSPLAPDAVAPYAAWPAAAGNNSGPAPGRLGGRGAGLGAAAGPGSHERVGPGAARHVRQPIRYLSRGAGARGVPDHQPDRGLRRHDRHDGRTGQRRRGAPAVLRLGRRRRIVAAGPGPPARRRPAPAGICGHPAGRRPEGWVAIGTAAPEAIWTSTDGLSWTLAARHGITPQQPGDQIWVLTGTAQGFLAAGAGAGARRQAAGGDLDLA